MILRLLIAHGLALSGLSLVGTPTHACSCVSLDVDRQAARATHVFVGEVTGSRTGGQRLIHDIDVSEVYKGDVPEVAQLASDALSSSCGLGRLPSGKEIAFFATTDPRGGLVSQSCSGTAVVTDDLSHQMSAAMGAPATLNQNGEPTPHTGLSSPEPDAAGDGAPLWPWLLALLAVAAGAATRAARRTT